MALSSGAAVLPHHQSLSSSAATAQPYFPSLLRPTRRNALPRPISAVHAAEPAKNSVKAAPIPTPVARPGKWAVDSWKSNTALQLPEYPNKEELETVLQTIASFPPIVFAGEARHLEERLADAALGKAFLLQGGDCAESFKEFNANNIRDTFRILLQMSAVLMFGGQVPVIKVGRMAGQFAKPRSDPFEEKNGVKLPSYRGDNINGDAFDEKSRTPDPQRMIRAAYRRKFWRNMMRSALTYEEWSHAAKMLDQEMTTKMNEGDLYDEELVRNKLQELRHRREEGSLKDIVFYMRTDLLRNLGNMSNPELHKGRLQVPKLIKEYIDEVSTQLKMVCDSDSDELFLEEKLAFVHETRHAFGRTALLLSGGASLGAFHVGVVKTLVEHKLLPRIIAGSSVGSIMCAVVATRSWPELESFFEDSWHSLQFFDQLGGIFTVVKRVMTKGAVHEIRQLQRLLRLLTRNLTFQEAYDMTGRILGITVCSPRKHEPPRCLNYLTSPHVVIWSAVTASCAFPGLFEAQELMAKDRFGEIVPYHAVFPLGPEDTLGATARRWRDGSLESDLPMTQLKELFNVNHFIVSQANPHIAPFLRLKEIVRAFGGNFAAKLAHLVEMEVKHRCDQVLELGFPLGGIAKLFAQDWEGDITLVMPATLAQYSKIIQNPSYVELQKAANQGRRCTWEKLSSIKANCAIELALDECLGLLNHMRRLKRSAERAATSQGHSVFTRNASRRIPSWNCIARENSTGSIEEDLLVDAAASYQATSPCGNSNRNNQTHRSMHDGSDSESESVDLNSWTRSGGPLMRTASANKFINFVENLEIELAFCRSKEDETEVFGARSNSTENPQVGRNPPYNSSRVTTPDRSSENTDSEAIGRLPLGPSCSITVSEGDLLQPEKIQNGIVLNVVKKDTLLAHRGSDFNQHLDYSREADIETIHMEACDATTTSGAEDDELTMSPHHH